MKFLSNTYDPKDEEGARMSLCLSFHESPEERWKNHLEWLEGKVIGRPQASEFYTVEQMEEMGLVGVYDPNREEDEEKESTKCEV